MTNSHETGIYYETLACKKLEEEGLKIIARNVRCKAGEIDIIALDKNELAFVEVKYRKNSEFGGAWYAIPVSKQNKIKKTARYFLSAYHIRKDIFCRFDAVLIDENEITHVKNAWY